MIGNTGFLFGGLSAGLHDKIARPLNELHILKMGSSEFEWCLLELADGQKPLARWRHSASIYDGTQIIIFEDTIQPLSVCQMCGCSTLSPWSGSSRIDQDPGFIANGSHPASSTWPGLPAPRGGHSATLIGHSMFIFGGYGGHGSIWRLFFLFFAAIYLIASVPQVTQDVTLMIFTALMFGRGHGRGLLRRDGAQSGALATNPVRSKHHCSFWGWNASQQFDDLFIMETKLNPPVWSCVEGSSLGAAMEFRSLLCNGDSCLESVCLWRS